MRLHSRRRSSTARPEVRRPRAPEDRSSPPTHHLHNLQRTLGNAVVSRLLQNPIQRTVTISNYNTTAGGVQEDQQLDIGAVRLAITAGVTDPTDRATVLGALNGLDAGNRNAPDVNTLAQTLSVGARKAATTAQVSNAIGSTLLNTNRTEGPLWEEIILRADSLSRAKGTPGTITTSKLETAIGVPVANILAAILRIDAALLSPPKDLENTDVGAWVATLGLKDNLNVRTAHDNGAGWMPAGAVPATFPGLQATVANRMATPNLAGIVTAGHKTEDQMRHYVVRRFLQPEQRRYFGWCSHGGNVSPYIEVGVPGEKDGRIIFDLERRLFFFTVHYNWHKGYNPFLQILP